MVPWKPLVLSDVVTNEGQAYNGTSGQFTPPVAGTYLLLVTTATPGMPGTIAEVEVGLCQCLLDGLLFVGCLTLVVGQRVV